MTHEICNSLSKQCTLGENGVGCIELFSSCADIKDLQQCEGTVLNVNRSCHWDTTSTTPICKEKECKLSIMKDSADSCEKYLETCTLGD